MQIIEIVIIIARQSEAPLRLSAFSAKTQNTSKMCCNLGREQYCKPVCKECSAN
ncbi:MAG: hypothetical protein MJZ20_01825 [Bacteroidaceae bacterium]|nr:hypothetical protein [Bacteroidaceae bacterium]